MRSISIVAALSGPLVGRGIGADAHHAAVEFGRRARVERGEAEHDRLTDLYLIDVSRLDLGFDQERI
jgi:hypothetical protein